jgi:hypothetical protein
MKFVPLLAIQRAINGIPVNERFPKYLEVMLEGHEPHEDVSCTQTPR